MCHVWHKPTHKCNSMVWMNWSGNSFLLTIRLRIKRPCSRILKLIQAIVFRINVLFILCSVLDVTNANLFEHYLNVLFMNLTINYIYSPSVVLSVEWRGPVLTIKAWVLSSIYHYSHQWSISHNCHTAYLSIDIYSFVFQIPYLIPAINHEQLIGAWLIIQLSHACLAWTTPGDLSTRRKKVSVSVWSVLTISPQDSGVNNAAPHTSPASLSPLTPGVRVHAGDEMVVPYSSCVRAPSSRTCPGHSAFPCVIRQSPCDERRGRARVTRPRVWSPSSASILPGKAGRGARRGRTHRSLLQLPPGPDPSIGEWRRKTPVNSGHRARDYDNERHWSEVTLRPCSSPITASVASCLESQSVREIFLVSDILNFSVSSSEYFLQVIRQPVILQDTDRCHRLVIPSRYRTLVSISDYLQRRQIVPDTMLLPSMTVDPKTTKTPYSDATQVSNKLKVKGDRKFIQLWIIKGERKFLTAYRFIGKLSVGAKI